AAGTGASGGAAGAAGTAGAGAGGGAGTGGSRGGGGASGSTGAGGTAGAATGGAAGITVPPGYKLVWSDEFDVDGRPSTANWRYETGFVRNEELQWYQSDNATVSGGLLIIEARK